jgi:hypothetical protein
MEPGHGHTIYTGMNFWLPAADSADVTEMVVRAPRWA